MLLSHCCESYSQRSDLEQGAEVGAESKSCNGDSSSDYFAHESRIAPEVADDVAAAVE